MEFSYLCLVVEITASRVVLVVYMVYVICISSDIVKIMSYVASFTLPQC